MTMIKRWPPSNKSDLKNDSYYTEVTNDQAIVIKDSRGSVVDRVNKGKPL